MKILLSFLFFLLASNGWAATAVKVNFTLNTTDENGAPLTQNRYYYVYRTDGFPTTTPLPMVMVMEANPGNQAYAGFNSKAAASGFVIVSWSPSAMTYQWQKTVARNANLIDVPGATSATYTRTLATASNEIYRCIVSNAAGSTTSASEFFLASAAAVAPSQIDNDRTVSAQVGLPFAWSIIADDGTAPLTYGASPLPPGLGINASTGLISGVPTAVGTTAVTLAVSNSAGATTAPLSFSVTSAPVPLSIGSWRREFFGASAQVNAITGDLADPEGDGVVNLFEYATGTDPLRASVLPTATGLINNFLTLSIAKNPRATGLTWSAESSGDLVGWSPNGATIVQDTATLFQARDNVPAVAPARHFLRALVTSPDSVLLESFQTAVTSSQATSR